MNNASVAGALFLFVVGVGFLGGGLVGWLRREDAGGSTGALRITIDVLVGAVALGDSAISVVDEPERIVLWSFGTFALAVAAALLVLHHRRALRRPRDTRGGRGAT